MSSEKIMPRQDHDDLNGNHGTKRQPTDTNTTRRPRSAVGEALHAHREAVDHCEALYLQHAGEVTDEAEAAEARRDVTAREAAEHVARYLRWLDDQAAAVKRERERLDAVEQRLAKRRQWAEGHAVALMETIAPGKAKATVGTLTLKVTRPVAVETTDALDLTQCPDAWVRRKPPATPPPELDKKAAKADLLLGYREGEPPCDGWYEVEGYGRVWLEWVIYGGTDRTYRIGTGPDDEGAESLAWHGLSITAKPGLDVLRWKPSPPGVTLVRRAHVKVD